MRIGIDLGGTKIEAIALDDDGGTLLRQRIAAPPEDYDATLEAVVSLVRKIEKDLADVGTIGVGIPGTISPASGLVKNANSTWLIGRPLAEDLTTGLGRPIRFANDANCFAVSEATDGAGAGAAVVFGVIVGTGTGGGIVVRGQLTAGPNGIAGEWGHNPLPWPGPDEWPGPPCYCGRSGCMEIFLLGSRVVRESVATAVCPTARLQEYKLSRQRGARREGRTTVARLSRSLRRSDGAGVGQRHQRSRPPRDCPGRRPVEPGPSLPGGAPALGSVRVL